MKAQFHDGTGFSHSFGKWFLSSGVVISPFGFKHGNMDERTCVRHVSHLKSEATKAAPLSAQITSEIIDKKTLHKGKDRESFLKCWKYKRNVRFVPTPEFLAQG
jgi:hypothetical protein